MNAKKLFLGALGAVASLAISSNALAYYGENAAAEYQPGFYVGLQAGYAQTWWEPNFDSIPEDFPGFGFTYDGAHGDYAGRGLVGYDFNEFFALELGLAYFKGGKTYADTAPIVTPLYQQEMRAYALDFVGKLSLPLDNGFRLFTKAGIQYFKTAHSPLFLDAVPPITDQKIIKLLRCCSVWVLAMRSPQRSPLIYLGHSIEAIAPSATNTCLIPICTRLVFPISSCALNRLMRGSS